MESIKTEQLKAVRKYVKSIFKSDLSPDISYHNWDETKLNIKKLQSLVDDSKVKQYDADIAAIAIYFYYIGYARKADEAIKESLKEAKTYLVQNNFTAKQIEDLSACFAIIIDNKSPNTNSQKLFSDVITSHYGEKKLKSRTLMSWEHKNYFKDEKTDLITYLDKVIKKMTDHFYYSPKAQKLYAYKKLNNLKSLTSYLSKEKTKNNLTNNKTALTMFKTALRNHIDLINIADKKAGIMISINAILMTLMIPILGSYIIDVSRFIIPSMILILTCGGAIIMATLATRPQMSNGRVDEDNKLSGKKSLFYFGNFFDMKKDEYTTAVKDVIVRDRILEDSIINDLYDIGVVLGVKYNRLRICYLIFAIGIGLTLISFIISYLFIPEL